MASGALQKKRGVCGAASKAEVPLSKILPRDRSDEVAFFCLAGVFVGASGVVASRRRSWTRRAAACGSWLWRSKVRAHETALSSSPSPGRAE